VAIELVHRADTIGVRYGTLVLGMHQEGCETCLENLEITHRNYDVKGVLSSINVRLPGEDEATAKTPPNEARDYFV